MDPLDFSVETRASNVHLQNLITLFWKPDADSSHHAKRRKTAPSRWSAIPEEPEWIEPLCLARINLSVHCSVDPSLLEALPALDQAPKQVDLDGRNRSMGTSKRSVEIQSTRQIFHHNLETSTAEIEVRTSADHLCHIHVPCERGGPLYNTLKAVSLDFQLFYPKNSNLRFPITMSYGGSTASTLILNIEAQILAKDSKALTDASFEELEPNVLGALFPTPNLRSSSEWVPQDFYDSVHIPQREGVRAEQAASLDVIGLECRLYPFQRRAVCWLLEREGVDVRSRPLDAAHLMLPPNRHGFVEASTVGGRSILVNEWLGIVTSNLQIDVADGTSCTGGLLAEEMGLGKTVEVISLLLLHQRPTDLPPLGTNVTLTPTRGTIIISPITIQQQWKTEIKMHSPGLRVMIYEGLKSTKADEEEIIDELIRYDVVLVSYGVLSQEVHYAVDGPDRALRHEKQYRKRRSPLVLVDWWRCVLDECQMIESGVSQAARVANQIPRRNAWAVSGTPLKKDAADLLGLLTYLRVEPYCYSTKLWNRLISRYKPIFADLFGSIGLRHSKERVKDELILPPQKRLVVTLPFTPIEEQHYTNLFQEMCEDCDMDLDGSPLVDGWSSDRYMDRMRSWLSRLRQTVLHPEVGERNRKALGSNEGPLRTVAEVLKVMTEQNETATRAEERTLLTSKLRRGQILEHAKKTNEAMDIWKDVLQQAQQIVDECRKEQAAHVADDLATEAEPAKIGGDASDEHDGPLSRVGAWRLRLRASLEVLHMATFFVANGLYQLKTNEDITKPDSEEFKVLEKAETEQYDEAKLIRKEMLTDTQSRANELMASVRSRKVVPVPECNGPGVTGGIESRHVIERAEDLCEALNEQAQKLREWRDAIIRFLLLPLIDQEESELQGDEYETSTKQQDEVYVYMEILRALEADRHDALTGQENLLISRDMAANRRAAKEGEGHSPELMLRLLQERDALKPKKVLGSFRNCISELRSLRNNLERQRGTRAEAEMSIMDRALHNLQVDLEAQTKASAELEKELDVFMSSSNSRLDFYRQLQTISDSVAPFEEEFDDAGRARRLHEMRVAEEKSQVKLATLESRGRYLAHLDRENGAQAEAKTCVICQETIAIGVLTACGHQFCKECLRHWWGSHRTCPVCKTKLQKNQFHPIAYKPGEWRVQEEVASTPTPVASSAVTPPSSHDPSDAIYTGLSQQTFDQIAQIDVRGSFGTKIDTLARHVLHLRQTDPGAKCIIFSQFRDFLDILARAFRRFRISFASVDDAARRPRGAGATSVRESGIERFQRDPSIECFFLHARAQAAGLNLVCATHVFLCEPLINTALELQAIARVHRIGQHRPTAVYVYLVEGTVEQAVYDISVRRRLAHVEGLSREPPPGVPVIDLTGPAPRRDATADRLAAHIEHADALTVQHVATTRLLAAGRSGGELVPRADVWACLFRHRGAVRPAAEEAEGAVARFLAGEAATERKMVARWK